MNIGIIGNGAIGTFVRTRLIEMGHQITAILVRTEKQDAVQRTLGTDILVISDPADFPKNTDSVADCAGHEALRNYGPATLAAGFDMVTVSIGLLADQSIADALEGAALKGNAKLHLASGAIGALDALRAGKSGQLDQVIYTGRKPPEGWRGTPAEDVLDLAKPLETAATHFEGTAREAALRYPKNANVAAAVALAGVGLDKTRVQLIADPDVTANIHQVTAHGTFGELSLQIMGKALESNPKSSALAAMSVLSKIEDLSQPICF